MLRLVGLDPAVRPTDTDETLRRGEHPDAYVLRLAATKAAAAAARGAVTVAGDTAVVVDGDVLGKPADDSHARDMLLRLSGRTHVVSTGVAVVDADGAVTHALVTTAVQMTELSGAAIDAYLATGEPLGKAGAYAIQGRAAAFVQRINGSWTNVVGLPLVETLALLRAAGVPIP